MNNVMGMECEIPHLPFEGAHIVDWCTVTVHDDGSIRNTNYVIDSVPILPMRPRKGEHKFIYPSGAVAIDNYGAELVTNPYQYPELRSYAVGIARMFGHVPTTPRASIHVHVDVADRPWRYIQNLVRWFIHLEAPLFRLSALGEEHRGCQWFFDHRHPERGYVKQDHNYARPLTDSIGIRRSNRMVPLIDVAGLVQARTASAFVAAWGRMDLTWGNLTRYCPHRLHALNIVPLQIKHTVEWRLFNGRYKYLPKVLDIINAVHVLAEKPLPSNLPVMPLGSEPIFTAADMGALLDMDVRDIWGKHWVSGCEMKARPSHYDDDFSAPGIGRTPVTPIFNNAAKLDTGDESYCFGVSGSPRGLADILRPRAQQREALNDVWRLVQRGDNQIFAEADDV